MSEVERFYPGPTTLAAKAESEAEAIRQNAKRRHRLHAEKLWRVPAGDRDLWRCGTVLRELPQEDPLKLVLTGLWRKMAGAVMGHAPRYEGSLGGWVPLSPHIEPRLVNRMIREGWIEVSETANHDVVKFTEAGAKIAADVLRSQCP